MSEALLAPLSGLNKSRARVRRGDPKLPGVGDDDEARAVWRRVTGFGDDQCRWRTT
jgi:hypothetical protein